MANKFCPNISLPESKALINKLGLLGFYREYIKQVKGIKSELDLDISDNVETIDNTVSVKDKLFINSELFSANQEESVVDSLVYQIQQDRIEGVTNVKNIFNNVLDKLKEEQSFYSQFKEDVNSLVLANQYQDVLDNFDKFFEKATNKLTSTDVRIVNEIKKINKRKLLCIY